MGPAPLPGGALEHRRDGVLEAEVGVRDDQLHARQPSRHQAAKEGRPRGPVLGGDDADAENLAVPLGVDRGPASSATPERQWTRASPGVHPPERAPVLILPARPTLSGQLHAPGMQNDLRGY
jgi:hypothetical protein